jgi:hypothetical protein
MEVDHYQGQREMSVRSLQQNHFVVTSTVGKQLPACPTVTDCIYHSRFCSSLHFFPLLQTIHIRSRRYFSRVAFALSASSCVVCGFKPFCCLLSVVRLAMTGRPPPRPTRSPSGPVVKPSTQSPSGPVVPSSTRSPSGPVVSSSTQSPSGPVVSSSTQSPSGPVVPSSTRSPSGPVVSSSKQSPSGPVVSSQSVPPHLRNKRQQQQSPSGPVSSLKQQQQSPSGPVASSHSVPPHLRNKQKIEQSLSGPVSSQQQQQQSSSDPVSSQQPATTSKLQIRIHFVSVANIYRHLQRPEGPRQE